MSLQNAINRYSKVAGELADLYRERGDVRSAQINASVMGYQQAVADGDNVSGARHAADMASLPLSRDVLQLDGEIQALEVELRYLDQLLTHYRTQDARGSTVHRDH